MDNRPFLLSYFPDSSAPERRVSLLYRVVALAITCSSLLSWKLWISTRLYPLTPVSNYLPAIPYPLDYIWFFSLLALLAAISLVSQPRKLIFVYLALAVLLSLWDQTRWQPWFYQCLFMLASIGLFAWRQPESENNQAAVDTCRLIVISTYLWTGFQKLNISFVRDTWPDMASFLPGFWHSIVKHIPPYVILFIPLLEIAIGLGLLTIGFRNRTVLVATAMHVVILGLLFLTGENIVVWPWNVAMVLFVWILFRHDTKTTARRIVLSRKPFHLLVLLLFGILPSLSLVGLWDSYLSSSVYSGNTYQAAVFMNPSVMPRLPAAIHPHIWQSTTPYFLDMNRWAYAELHVPVYPEPRIFQQTARQICKYAQGDPSISLWIRQKPDPLTGSFRSKYYNCEELDRASNRIGPRQ